LRSFIAIELPETAKSFLAGLQQDFKNCGADIRWVKPENIHLTLKFLGNIEEKQIDNIIKVIEKACSKYAAFNFRFSGVDVFPRRGSPRVLWVGMNGNETLTGLQQEIDIGLVKLGFERENRKFVPHLTLGRFKSSRGKVPLLDKIKSYKNNKSGLTDVSSVSLIKSDLSPAGARYTRIAEVSLGKVDV
jgi:2'-5' RNA ligase